MEISISEIKGLKTFQYYRDFWRKLNAYQDQPGSSERDDREAFSHAAKLAEESMQKDIQLWERRLKGLPEEWRACIIEAREVNRRRRMLQGC